MKYNSDDLPFDCDIGITGEETDLGDIPCPLSQNEVFDNESLEDFETWMDEETITLDELMEHMFRDGIDDVITSDDDLEPC